MTVITLPFSLEFVEVVHEVDLLEEYLDTLEECLAEAIARENKSYSEKIEKESCIVEIEIARQERDMQIECVLPKFFRNPVVVVLWSTLESCFTFSANYIYDKKSAEVEFKEFRESKKYKGSKDFIESIGKYFTDILNLPLPFDGKEKEDLKKLKIIRESICHAGGQIEFVKNKKTKKQLIN